MVSIPARAARVFLVGLLSFAALLPGASVQAEPSGLRSLLRPGEKAPSFTLSDIDGKRYSFSPVGGKPSLILFWSAFCPLCRELVPSLTSRVRGYGPSIRFVNVNLDGKRFSNAVRSFARDYVVGGPILLDDVRGDLFVASDPYGIEKTPTAVLVDAAGTVHAAYAPSELQDMIGKFERIADGLKKGAGISK
jgi:thiol-disulfide isomerase/thioredoxin